MIFLILSYIVLTSTLADVFDLFAREVGDGFLSFPAIMTYLKDDLPSSRCLLRKFCPGELTPALLLYYWDLSYFPVYHLSTAVIKLT